MKISNVLKKGSLQVLGMILFGIGVALVVFTGAGASPLDAFANYMMQLTGVLGQGDWTTILNVMFAIIVFLLTKNKLVFISIIISVLNGFIINFWIDILSKIFTSVDFGSNQTLFLVYNNSFLEYLFVFAFGILGLSFLALGIAILIVNKLYLTPYDDMSVYLETKTKKYWQAKSILDGVCLVIALILGVIINNVWNQINVFSFVVVFGLGPLIGMFIKILSKNKKVIQEELV